MRDDRTDHEIHVSKVYTAFSHEAEYIPKTSVRWSILMLWRTSCDLPPVVPSELAKCTIALIGYIRSGDSMFWLGKTMAPKSWWRGWFGGWGWSCTGSQNRRIRSWVFWPGLLKGEKKTPEFSSASQQHFTLWPSFLYKVRIIVSNTTNILRMWHVCTTWDKECKKLLKKGGNYHM